MPATLAMSPMTAGPKLRSGMIFDVAALQQIIQATDPVPAIAVGLQEQPVLAAGVRTTVIFAQQVH